jgi:DNA-binding transcriptional MerR regulator
MKMKIGQVARLSRVPTTTIHYYVKQGLLGAPEKINKRVCLYDASVIERLKTIQSLQEKRFPLFSIKKILARIDQGITMEEAETVENVVFGLPAKKADELINRKVYMEQTGLTPKELEELERHGLLIPFQCEKGKGLYDQDDVAMGKSVFKTLFVLNVPMKDIKFYVTLGRQITDKEFNLRRKITRGMTAPDNAKVTVDLANGAILCRSYFLRRLFQRKVQEKSKERS